MVYEYAMQNALSWSTSKESDWDKIKYFFFFSFPIYWGRKWFSAELLNLYLLMSVQLTAFECEL